MSCGGIMVESKSAATNCADSYNKHADNSNANPKRSRRVSSSALYEVWRKDLNDVCYLFVPDEYVSIKLWYIPA